MSAPLYCGLATIGIVPSTTTTTPTTTPNVPTTTTVPVIKGGCPVPVLCQCNYKKVEPVAINGTISCPSSKLLTFGQPCTKNVKSCLSGRIGGGTATCKNGVWNTISGPWDASSTQISCLTP
ncbi:hypothetical protein PRIPAC_70125 [Pristionchus pacificus]|uniref:Uncharacterized protein n=1 Tax=Pristionchus pacificus TaxID=54126 RepID=A0A2A6CS89_PRIPA|nr:hypothetical protein PRIPAC_70125 [Pristionchus pacificus]|eukprot:PDM80937.1 hypothetical protein PRIPAC_35940 [Pristionchus pacificus]